MNSESVIDHYQAIVEVVVADELVEENIGFLPWVMGENLAGQVDAYATEQALGYYPALDYFRDLPLAVDQDLLLLTDELAWWCQAYAKREVRRHLSHTFSTVTVTGSKVLAYTLPRIRLSREGAPQKLAAHYSPNRLRLELKIGVLRRSSRPPMEARKLLRAPLTEGLGEAFASCRLEHAAQL